MDATDPQDAHGVLRGMGKYGRRILLLAPGPAEDATVILPERDGRTALDSHNRAMRRLAAAGLVSTTRIKTVVETKRIRTEWEWDNALMDWVQRPVPVRQMRWREAVKLTPVGAAVVDRLRSEAAGEPPR
jgi:hypothetical protein